MSDDTSTIRILDVNPERVVSVTVGELQEIVRSHPKTAYQFHTLAIHERTCHMQKIDWMDKIGNKSLPRHKVVCSACGLELESDMSRCLPSFYHFCPNCGARLVGE